MRFITWLCQPLYMKKKYKNINRFIIDKAVNDFASEVPEGAIVLDIGAGGGHYRNLFSGKKYIAIDIGLEQLRYRGLNIIGDICSLPFKNEIAKYALCVEVFEHIYERDKFLKELTRVVQKGGKLLLTTPLCIGEHMEPFDFFRYTKFGIEKSIRQSGMKLCKIEPRGGYFYFCAYHIRRFPEYITVSEDMPCWLKKVIRRLLNPIFTYIIPFFLFSLDRFDTKKSTTLGYICIIQKECD